MKEIPIMALKILAAVTALFGIVTAGCGLAIHYRWVGEMESIPHLALGSLFILLSLSTAVAALLTR